MTCPFRESNVMRAHVRPGLQSLLYMIFFYWKSTVLWIHVGPKSSSSCQYDRSVSKIDDTTLCRSEMIMVSTPWSRAARSHRLQLTICLCGTRIKASLPLLELLALYYLFRLFRDKKREMSDPMYVLSFCRVQRTSKNQGRYLLWPFRSELENQEAHVCFRNKQSTKTWRSGLLLFHSNSQYACTKRV
jgi:hypothetical protein